MVYFCKINDPARQLNPILEVPASLKPDETFTIKVKEKQNKPMAYTLAIVDEGLLDLTRFKTLIRWITSFKNITWLEYLGFV